MCLLKTVIMVSYLPMTSKGFNFIFRPKIKFDKKDGLVLLDKIRTVDKTRLIKRLGTVNKKTSQEISKTLIQMFEL